MVCNNQSPTGKFSIGKSPKIASNYIILEDWMFDLVDLQTKKELSAIPLHVYALVYGFSKHNAGMFIGSREYIAKRLHISLASCYRALEVLQKMITYVSMNATTIQKKLLVLQLLRLLILRMRISAILIQK